MVFSEFFLEIILTIFLIFYISSSNVNLIKAEATVSLDKILRLKDLSDEIISLKGNGSMLNVPYNNTWDQPSIKGRTISNF